MSAERLFQAVIPLFILLALVVGFIKKTDVYSAFVGGVNQTIPLLLSIFPYLTAILIMAELMDASGLSDALCTALSPVMRFLQIPPELTRLILLKPFSGSGSLALLDGIFKSYGTDHYISRCAACIFGSSETLFYVIAVYTSKCKIAKKRASPILASLIASLLSTVLACLICRVL